MKKKKELILGASLIVIIIAMAIVLVIINKDDKKEFEDVQKITHCSTGCGGCHDKIMAIISDLMSS